MRIGILTLPLNSNYGGILQAYALQKVLERKGHNVRVINRPLSALIYRSLWRKSLSVAKSIVKKLRGDQNAVIFIDAKNCKEMPIVRRNTDRFIDQYIHSYMIHSFDDIRSGDFDAIVVGSDQIWRPRYFRILFGNRKYENAFLGFAKDWDIKRYAYAASFGVDKWEFPSIGLNEYKQLAQKFIAISVREDSGVTLCRQYLNAEAVHVLDPTMLLTADDYLSLTNSASTPESAGNLLCYVLDVSPEKQGLIDRIASERSLKPFSVKAKGFMEHVDIQERIHPPVESWLRGFEDAKFVITDSFHACVFSILFGKPFIVIGNAKRGLSRMQSLLAMFDLQDHLLLDVSEYTPDKSYSQPESVKQKLAELRRKSMEFLDNIK